MGRTIVFDDYVQESLNSIVKRNVFETGLIVGQVTSQRDIAIHLCPTPSKSDIPKKTESDEATNKKEKKKSKGQKVPNSDDELDEKWFCQHARQVTRMLPGGLVILGLYSSLSPDSVNNIQPKLRQLLFAMYKVLLKNPCLPFEKDVPDRILLQVCTVTHKCTCRTIDVSDYKSSANPADWKPYQGTPRWHRLETRFSLDLKIPVSQERSTHSLLKQMESGLSPVCQKTLNATALVNGVIRKEEELLDPSQESKKSRHKDKEEKSQKCFSIELFLPLTCNNIPNPEVIDCSSQMAVKGTIQSLAFVHTRATIQEAIQALKQDIIRSITSRCEIHCEDLLLIDEEQQDPVVVHELPRRVFAPLPQGDISVCDYLFHGDSASDSLDAFRELLNLELTEEDIDMSCEMSPDTYELIQNDALDDRLSDVGDFQPSHRNLLIPVASAAVAAVAAGLSYLLLLQDS